MAMKVRISDTELARCIAVGLACTGKRGQSNNAEISVLRQLGRYDLFRDADHAEAVSKDVPLFPDNYGLMRASDLFEQQERERRIRRCDFDWPLKIDWTIDS